MRRERPYYTLVQRDAETGTYQPQFGDYDKGCVRFELAEYRYQGVRANDLRIVKCRSARAPDIQAALKTLH